MLCYAEVLEPEVVYDSEIERDYSEEVDHSNDPEYDYEEITFDDDGEYLSEEVVYDDGEAYGYEYDY